MDAAIGASLPAPPSLRPAAGAAVRVEAASAPQGSADRAAGGGLFVEPLGSSRREVQLDGPTGSLVYRLIDVTTGTVTQQTPTEGRLKLRAYIDGVIAASADEPLVERIA